MGEILACPSAPHIDKIHVALLDCHDVARLDRLWSRGTPGATQEMLSWAAWQRIYTVDPQWREMEGLSYKDVADIIVSRPEP